MRNLVRLIAIPALVFVSRAALADSPAPPRDYVMEVPGGEYVFVMLAPGDWGANEGLRAKWSRAGLYRIDDPESPLWTIDWFAHSVIPFGDGIRLVRWGPWAETTDDLAVGFYANGDELNHYHIRELIEDESRLERSVSHFEWTKDWSVDEESGVLTIETTDGQRLRFDTAEGHRLDRE